MLCNVTYRNLDERDVLGFPVICGEAGLHDVINFRQIRVWVLDIRQVLVELKHVYQMHCTHQSEELAMIVAL